MAVSIKCLRSVSSEAVVTHSSAGAEYAAQSDLAAVQSQMPRLRAPGRGPSELLLYMNGVLCLLPTPARTGSGGGRSHARSSCPGTRPGREKQGKMHVWSIWKVCDKSTFGLLCYSI